MSKNSIPTVSVVMPVYNSAEYLPLAIESILNQTYKDFEFIIIDDGSTDASWDIIRQYSQQDRRIRVKQNFSNLGICRTLNYGLSLAKGKYIARMDADDWSYPDRFLKQVSFMEANPKVVICGGAIQVCNADLKILNKRLYPTTDGKIRKNILKMNPFAHPVAMFQREAIIKAGEYNEKLSTVEDYDLYFRLGSFGKFTNLADTLLKLRVRPDSISYANINKQIALHLFVRLKGVTEYGYTWHFMDFFYFVAELTGLLIIPTRFKFKIFNIFRSTLR